MVNLSLKETVEEPLMVKGKVPVIMIQGFLQGHAIEVQLTFLKKFLSEETPQLPRQWLEWTREKRRLWLENLLKRSELIKMMRAKL
jgi:hypothetical protein